MARSADLKTPLGRFAFVDGLFKPQENTLSKKKSWTCSMLFPKTTVDLAPLVAAVKEAAVEEWGEKAAEALRIGDIKSPFLDGDGKQGRNKTTSEPHKGFPGNTFIRLQSGEEYRPTLVNRKKLPVTSKEEFYSGVWGFAVVNAFTWENKENGRGVSFGISMAQATRDDEKLGGVGAGNPDDWFDVVEDTGEAPQESRKGKGAGSLFD